ncbi:MAG: KH domain-containing protein [Clostridia bacterium]|nr:KH domain-containing protein [Clostridia bacterium]
MEELVRMIAESLVDHPEQVQVKTVEGPDSIVLELSVGPDDMGKVIGKQGRIAKAIRTVVKAATARSEKPVFVEILE